MIVRHHFEVCIGRKQGKQQFRCKYCNKPSIVVSPSFYDCGGTSIFVDGKLLDHLREHVNNDFKRLFPWLDLM